MVPFGFERKELEREMNNITPEPQYTRIYLDVTAERTVTGELIPRSFQWEGRTYRISQVINYKSGQSMKQHTNAVRYYCSCGGKKFQLFYEDGGFGNQRFYIELKDNITGGNY